MRGTAPLARIAALIALVAATTFIAVMLLGGPGEDYQVKARFENASQHVRGNLVQVSGMPAGNVEDIRLTRDGQAELTLSIDDDYGPLRQGTLATVRQASLSASPTATSTSAFPARARRRSPTNAFGIVEGADVKVAGVRAGRVTGMSVDRRGKRALAASS